MRFFNTSGPVVPADHCCIPPLARVDLDDICEFGAAARMVPEPPERGRAMSTTFIDAAGVSNAFRTWFADEWIPNPEFERFRSASRST